VTFITTFNFATNIQTDEAIYFLATERKVKGLKVLSIFIEFSVPNGLI
jgi:hypothetical protein